MAIVVRVFINRSKASCYYIADVNIESVFHDITSRKTYLPYSGICLTDTFQLAEKKHNELFTEFFQDNSKRVKKQMATHVRVIVGNPPYSIGQKSANDNAQNLSYPYLDNRVSETYAVKSSATLNKSLYANIATGVVENNVLKTELDLGSSLETYVDATQDFLSAKLPWAKNVFDVGAEFLYKTDNFFTRGEYMYKHVTKERDDQALFEANLGSGMRPKVGCLLRSQPKSNPAISAPPLVLRLIGTPPMWTDSAPNNPPTRMPSPTKIISVWLVGRSI